MILVTNDDGVSSKGLAVLAAAISRSGRDVLVVAPSADRSGTGAAIGPVHERRDVGYERVELDGAGDLKAYSAEATPALIVLLARLGAFGERPELVISGINPGNNTGKSVLHSGTVGAVLTSASMGISGIAVSIGSGEPLLWESAAFLALRALDEIAGLPAGTAVNLNVPNLPVGEIRGVRPARLAPFGTVRTAVSESSRGRLQVELRSTFRNTQIPGTDTALLAEKFATVTLLTGLRTTDASVLALALDQKDAL